LGLAAGIADICTADGFLSKNFTDKFGAFNLAGAGRVKNTVAAMSQE